MAMFWTQRVAIVLGILLPFAANADVRVKRDDFRTQVYVSGTISRQDAISFRGLEMEFAFKHTDVFLDSRGGDVDAAMEMGRIIRKHDLATSITAGKYYSSCALIFIAGMRRTNIAGEIGLHRPYLASSPASRDAIERQVSTMLASVKTYVSEMGITENFYHEMVNTDPSRMRIYTDKNYKTLIPELDPVYEEVQIAREARQYGISPVEARRRTAYAGSCFPGLGIDDFDKLSSAELKRLEQSMRKAANDPKGQARCRGSRMWGLSEPVYEERLEQSKRICGDGLSDEEALVVEKVPLKQKHDHPFVIKFWACTRNVMLGRKL